MNSNKITTNCQVVEQEVQEKTSNNQTSSKSNKSNNQTESSFKSKPFNFLGKYTTFTPLEYQKSIQNLLFLNLFNKNTLTIIISQPRSIYFSGDTKDLCEYLTRKLNESYNNIYALALKLISDLIDEECRRKQIELCGKKTGNMIFFNERKFRKQLERELIYVIVPMITTQLNNVFCRIEINMDEFPHILNGYGKENLAKTIKKLYGRSYIGFDFMNRSKEDKINIDSKTISKTNSHFSNSKHIDNTNFEEYWVKMVTCPMANKMRFIKNRDLMFFSPKANRLMRESRREFNKIWEPEYIKWKLECRLEKEEFENRIKKEVEIEKNRLNEEKKKEDDEKNRKIEEVKQEKERITNYVEHNPNLFKKIIPESLEDIKKRKLKEEEAKKKSEEKEKQKLEGENKPPDPDNVAKPPDIVMPDNYYKIFGEIIKEEERIQLNLDVNSEEQKKYIEEKTIEKLEFEKMIRERAEKKVKEERDKELLEELQKLKEDKRIKRRVNEGRTIMNLENEELKHLDDFKDWFTLKCLRHTVFGISKEKDIKVYTKDMEVYTNVIEQIKVLIKSDLKLSLLHTTIGRIKYINDRNEEQTRDETVLSFFMRTNSYYTDEKKYGFLKTVINKSKYLFEKEKIRLNTIKMNLVYNISNIFIPEESEIKKEVEEYMNVVNNYIERCSNTSWIKEFFENNADWDQRGITRQ